MAVALVLGASVLLAPASAGAFGTVDVGGQHAEHEKITRVLSCDATDAPARCFQPKSLDELAGASGTFGAVGAPDRLLEVTQDGSAHCDAGDYLPGIPYAATGAARAALALKACIDSFERHLDEALAAADDLVDADSVIPRQARINFVESGINGGTTEQSACTYPRVASDGARQSAKCRVYNGLGRALHAAEDFWSHSNWADQADPSKPTILPPGTRQTMWSGWNWVWVTPGNSVDPVYSLTNPIGLHKSELVPFLRYPVARDTIPSEADERAGSAPITGCDDSLEELVKITLPECVGRVPHSVLNKDKGLINWRTGGTSDPSTPRGKTADNFARAVDGARRQAKAVWGDLAERVVARYGERRGALMVRAITSDTPWTDCRIGASAGNERAYYPPVGAGTALRSITARVINRTDQALACDVITLDYGEWASMPPDAVAASNERTFRVESNMSSNGKAGGPEGTVTYKIGRTAYSVRFTFNNPIVGSNSFSCGFLRGDRPDATAPYRCAVENQGGNDASPRFVVSAR
ncbi:hypothetical protein [Conexibacter sp. CPCC 206217]|uniref:hypothetical protein n=1 Tax=Conexibacter sp. CPCC 206217 TaxID=3064574 RepID=UPI002723B0EF|nr:hypothetical protein [Conexibacter sp. CPCC 206217]MDO8209582.1 hypothetical protein [Conexibacter sp. CPCC 206217]